MLGETPATDRLFRGNTVGRKESSGYGSFPVGVTLGDAVSLRRREADEEVFELAALADGSLAPDRRAALEAQVAASPELAEQLAEQQRAVALAQGAAAEVDAPASLRARVEAQR